MPAQAASTAGPAPTRRPNGRYSVPRVPEGVIPRPRLADRIEDGAARGMVVVSGPAGAGKTLLLASWAGQRRVTPSWLSLEPEDAEPERFWTRVLQALQTSPHLAPTSLLATMVPPPRHDPRFAGFVVDACQELPAPVVLVVEDLHQLSGSAAMASLAELTRRGLGNLRLVISTRTDPTLPLQRLRVGDQLTELTADDLAFDASEAVALLAQYDLHLSPGQLGTLLERTEGWAAGIRLAALSLSTRPDVETAVQELAGDHRDVADFFVEEVIDQLPRHLTEFLLDTCLPRRICADLANALTGRYDGQMVLADLERHNLFVVALDDRRSWYRYHHLFGELLRHRLAATSPRRVRELNLLAAGWFAGHEEPMQAAAHLADAGAWSDLARFVTRSAGVNLLGVERHTLVEVLQRVPDELVRDDPEMATAAAVACYARYDVQGLHAHVARARALQHRLTGLEAAIVDAVLTTLEAIGAWLDGDAEVQSAAATAALGKLGRLGPAAVPALSTYLGGAGVVLGMGLLWTGRLDQAEAALGKATKALESEPAVPPVLAVHLHGNLAVLRAFQGRLREARREAEAALARAERSGWLFLPQSAMALLAEAVVALVRGEDERCGATLERCRTSLADLEDRFALATLALVQARLEVTTGRPEAAAATVRDFRSGARDWRLPWFLQRWLEIVDLEIALTAGDPDERDDLLRRLEGGWESARPEAHRVALVARGHLHANRPKEALRLLEPVTAGPAPDVVPAVDAWVVTALAHDRLRDDAEAIAALQRAVALAEEESVVRPFLLSGGRMRVLLERQRQVHPGQEAFVRRLLTALGADPSGLEPRPLLEPLTQRERSVLTLLPTMMSNGEIADELCVSVNTVKVHLKSLYRKLGVTSRRHAVARARELALVDDGAPSVPS